MSLAKQAGGLCLDVFITAAVVIANIINRFYIIFHVCILIAIITAFSLVGGLIFQQIEAPPEARIIEAILRQRNATLSQLGTKVRAGENEVEIRLYVQEYESQYIGAIRNGTVIEDGREHSLWTFGGSVYYCLTTYTLLGYGNVAPKTSLGRVMAIIYCGFSIPITSLITGEIGQVMLSIFDFIWQLAWTAGTLACRDFKKNFESKKDEEGDSDENISCSVSYDDSMVFTEREKPIIRYSVRKKEWCPPGLHKAPNKESHHEFASFTCGITKKPCCKELTHFYKETISHVYSNNFSRASANIVNEESQENCNTSITACSEKDSQRKCTVFIYNKIANPTSDKGFLAVMNASDKVSLDYSNVFSPFGSKGLTSPVSNATALRLSLNILGKDKNPRQKLIRLIRGHIWKQRKSVYGGTWMLISFDENSENFYSKFLQRVQGTSSRTSRSLVINDRSSILESIRSNFLSYFQRRKVFQPMVCCVSYTSAWVIHLDLNYIFNDQTVCPKTIFYVKSDQADELYLKKTCECNNERTCKYNTERTCGYNNERACGYNNDRMCECNNERTCECNNKKTCECNNERTCEYNTERTCGYNNESTCEYNNDRMCECNNERTCECNNERTCECNNERTCECNNERTCECNNERTCECNNERTCECNNERTCEYNKNFSMSSVHLKSRSEISQPIWLDCISKLISNHKVPNILLQEVEPEKFNKVIDITVHAGDVMWRQERNTPNDNAPGENMLTGSTVHVEQKQKEATILKRNIKRVKKSPSLRKKLKCKGYSNSIALSQDKTISRLNTRITFSTKFRLMCLATPFRNFIIGKIISDALRCCLSRLKSFVRRRKKRRLFRKRLHANRNNSGSGSADKEKGGKRAPQLKGKTKAGQKDDEDDDDTSETSDDEDDSDLIDATDSSKVVEKAAVPILMTLCVCFLFIAAGALVLTWVSQNLGYFDSFWFIFISVITIGYGDVVPTDQAIFVGLLGYIFIGLSIMANVINECSNFFSTNLDKSKAIGGDALAIILARKELYMIQYRSHRAREHWDLIRFAVRDQTLPAELIEESRKFKANIMAEEKEYVRWAYKIYFQDELARLQAAQAETDYNERVKKVKKEKLEKAAREAGGADSEGHSSSPTSSEKKLTWWQRLKRAVVRAYNRVRDYFKPEEKPPPPKEEEEREVKKAGFFFA